MLFTDGLAIAKDSSCVIRSVWKHCRSFPLDLRMHRMYQNLQKIEIKHFNDPTNDASCEYRRAFAQTLADFAQTDYQNISIHENKVKQLENALNVRFSHSNRASYLGPRLR